MDKVNTTGRLDRLRQLMKERDIDVYIVPSEDSHQSEYIAPCDARRAYICGFDGSAGTAVITMKQAAIATDGRYFNQAAKQLDDNWELLKQGLQDVPTWQEWTADQSESGKTVGVDPAVITSSDARKLAEKIKKKGGRDLVAVKDNLVDMVWGDARPPRPNEKTIVLDHQYAGKGIADKIEDLRKELSKKKSAGIIISMLDEVAWLFNLRGNDIPYNPVFFSYAIVTPKDATLYIDDSKLDAAAVKHLKNHASIKPYESVFDDAKAYGNALVRKDGSSSGFKQSFIISTKASWALSQSLGGEENVDEIRSPVGDAKALKNDTEVEGMRQCHIRDGAALSAYFAWLEDQLISRKTTLDEVEAADKLEELRKSKDRFMGLSFPTISSTGPNAAVVHYQPQRGNCSVIDPDQIYLCDSGAQYLDGTTDTTRTLHFGQPSKDEKIAYTLVLKGNIALELARFPKGTSGFALDSLARQFLWKEGLDYRHGTGHGVGSFLNVHEGPIGIGTRVQYADVPLAVGHVVSDEPGYYEDGKFGIRIENIIIVKEVKTKHQFGDKPYLGFEHVTMVPLCRKLIDVSMLTHEEREFINSYHAEVVEKTRNFFDGDDLTLKWLDRETASI